MAQHDAGGVAAIAANTMVASAFITLLFACSPDISSNTYYCGPEGFCPPGLSCQFGRGESFSYSCVLPESAAEFSCPRAVTDLEPNDQLETAFQLGILNCNSQISFSDLGCIPNTDDVDLYQFSRETICNGDNPRIKVRLQVPSGASPLSLSLLDENGSLIEIAAICSAASEEDTGLEVRCIEASDLPVGTFFIRVSYDDDANANCGGQCSFNRYQLDLSSPTR